MTQDPWSQPKWSPKAEPYRVIWYFRSARYGMHGWDSRTQTFPTLDDAKAAVASDFRRYTDIELSKAGGDLDNWVRRGKWLYLAKGRERIASLVEG